MTFRATMPTRSEPRTPIHRRLRVRPEDDAGVGDARDRPDCSRGKADRWAPPAARGTATGRRGAAAGRAGRRRGAPVRAGALRRRGCSCLAAILGSVRRDARAFLFGICSGKLGCDAQMGRSGARIGLRLGLGGRDGAARQKLCLGLVPAHANGQLGRANAALREPSEEPLDAPVLQRVERDRGQAAHPRAGAPRPREARDRPTRARRSPRCGSPGRSAWRDGPRPNR